ncbi:hypothetical protein HELRODRAFT_183556 [Helobdella robusta]|uniref:Uncharacterized protein n=1 Tax=Helobdella robusta TaxID=6412 RepID=T1FJU3_HELRO|nr:hypothetical protein HELRODRAFT_183556 [Helobdella robusta]ESO10524.1 hypothetical protein HELRODRAFT_183556 [Helobdella robusta]
MPMMIRKCESMLLYNDHEILEACDKWGFFVIFELGYSRQCETAPGHHAALFNENLRDYMTLPKFNKLGTSATIKAHSCLDVFPHNLILRRISCFRPQATITCQHHVSLSHMTHTVISS